MVKFLTKEPFCSPSSRCAHPDMYMSETGLKIPHTGSARSAPLRLLHIERRLQHRLPPYGSAAFALLGGAAVGSMTSAHPRFSDCARTQPPYIACDFSCELSHTSFHSLSSHVTPPPTPAHHAAPGLGAAICIANSYKNRRDKFCIPHIASSSVCNVRPYVALSASLVQPYDVHSILTLI